MPKTVLDLTGKWEFKEYPLTARRMRDLDSVDWLSANIPASIFTCLTEAGKIQRSEIDTYPERFAWVSEKPWVFKKSFDILGELSNSNRIDLVFDGLDTIANIWLNEKLIGRTDNMFISHRFDVTKYLKTKKNVLIVKFDPAVPYAEKLKSRYGIKPVEDFMNRSSVFIRKAQYQFGWDWCPPMPGCGIWQQVKLEGIEKAAIEDVHIRTVHCEDKYADIRVAVKMDFISKENLNCKVTLSGHGEKIEHKLSLNRSHDFSSTVFRVDNPALWWPIGYGEQNLYKVDVEIFSGDKPIDKIQKNFGIRTIKLNRSSDKGGQKFQFEINHQPVYAKGACWIPQTLFAGSTTTEDYERLLEAAQNANINMLRIWGGGYYENDEFYDLCDKLGIMVWQDFMFACGYYPDKKWFTNKIESEVTQIVKRLRNHACIVLWCGNNEIDWMHSMRASSGKGRKFYGKNIFHKLLPQMISELDHDRNYIPTTPVSVSKEPNDPHCGTYHNWEVWSFHKPIRHYYRPAKDIPRFVAEFGMQSLPCLETIKSFCTDQHLRIGDEVLEKHNYQLDGNARLYSYMGELFGSAKNFEQFIYLSQLTQARAVKTYVEYLRAHSEINSGTLFWQFNDCSPAISWSAIDYQRRPKALFYYARRFFSNLLISIVPEFDHAKEFSLPNLNSISAVAINQTNQPIAATLKCQLIDLFGSCLDKVELPIALGPFSVSRPIKLPKAFHCPDQAQKCALYVTMQKDGQKLSENSYFYVPDKYVDWPATKISTNMSQISERKWNLKLRSNVFAKDIHISFDGDAKLSDNFIDLLPNEETEISLETNQLILTDQTKPRLISVSSIYLPI